MITINLLSPDQKRELKIKKIYIAVKELVMLILLFTSIIAIMLIISRYVLEQQLANLIKSNVNASQAGGQINKQITALNKKINIIGQIQQNSKKWSSFFSQLATATPTGIAYNFLKIDSQGKTVELQGIAKNRQDLLKLQKNLTESGLSNQVDLPLSSLLSRENNNFNLQFKVNLDQIP